MTALAVSQCGGCTLAGNRCERAAHWTGDGDWFCHQHTPNVRILDRDDNEIIRLHIRYSDEELLALKEEYPDNVNIDESDGSWALTSMSRAGSVRL